MINNFNEINYDDVNKFFLLLDNKIISDQCIDFINSIDAQSINKKLIIKTLNKLTKNSLNIIDQLKIIVIKQHNKIIDMNNIINEFNNNQKQKKQIDNIIENNKNNNFDVLKKSKNIDNIISYQDDINDISSDKKCFTFLSESYTLPDRTENKKFKYLRIHNNS